MNNHAVDQVSQSKKHCVIYITPPDRNIKMASRHSNVIHARTHTWTIMRLIKYHNRRNIVSFILFNLTETLKRHQGILMWYRHTHMNNHAVDQVSQSKKHCVIYIIPPDRNIKKASRQSNVIQAHSHMHNHAADQVAQSKKHCVIHIIQPDRNTKKTFS